MFEEHKPSILLTSIGFAIAVVGSIWLAVQANAGLSFGDILLQAMIIFVPVAILIGWGLLLYLRKESPDTSNPAITSDMRYQRDLMDIVKREGHVHIDKIADELNISRKDAENMVVQLAELQIFDGTIDWETGMLHARHAKQLQ